jgi:hypothetical protein
MKQKNKQTDTFREDLLGAANGKAVGHCTMRVLYGIQDYPKEVQLLAIAALFLFICREWKVSIPNALQIAENIIRGNGTLPQFRAAQMYVKEDM